jgi:hypothetical protein
MSEESEVKSYERQDNANVHCQPFPQSVSEEREIYTDYDRYHRHQVKHVSYLSAHLISFNHLNSTRKSVGNMHRSGKEICAQTGADIPP